METYTWVMGDTYVIPLMLSIWYFVIIRKMVTTRLISGRLKFGAYFTNILLFVGGMMMENISAIMIVAIIILLIYCFNTRKYLMKYLIINLIFAITAFALMRLSPGSTLRLMRDSSDFAALSIFGKIAVNYSNFLEQTFISNYYTISIFSFILIIYTIKSNVKNTILKAISIIIQLLAIYTLFSFVLGNSFINDPTSLYSYIFWIVYVIDAYLVLFLLSDKNVIKERSIFYLTIAGGSALVMLMSPIYGARSSIYLIYYLIVVSLILFDSIKLDYKISMIIFIVLVLLVVTRSYRTIKKYNEMNDRYQIRLQEIEYYKNHPEEKDAWFIRMPIGSVHGSDIEPDDIYHLETFKIFYDLPQEAQNIHFYYPGEH